MTDDREPEGVASDERAHRVAPVTALFGQRRSESEGVVERSASAGVERPEPLRREVPSGTEHEHEAPAAPSHLVDGDGDADQIAPVVSLPTRWAEPAPPARATDAGDVPADEQAESPRRRVRHLSDGMVALPWRAPDLGAADVQQQQFEREQRGRRAGPSAAMTEAEADAPTPEQALADAEQRLLRRLRRADRSREELRRELAGDELLDETGIEQVLERLESHGYIDDSRMAEALADKLLDRRGKGIEAVRRELRHRLLPDDAIAQAIEGRERDDEFARAAQLAGSRADRLRGVDREVALRRLVGFLQRRGFGSGVAFIAANEALDGVDRGFSSGSKGAGAGDRSDASARGVYFGNADD